MTDIDEDGFDNLMDKLPRSARRKVLGVLRGEDEAEPEPDPEEEAQRAREALVPTPVFEPRTCYVDPEPYEAELRKRFGEYDDTD